MKTVYVLGAGPVAAAIVSRLVNCEIHIVVITGQDLSETNYPFVEFESESKNIDVSKQVKSGLDGTGKIWGGRLVKFDEEDFSKIHGQTGELIWPLTYAEYSSFFEVTDQFFGITKSISNRWRSIADEINLPSKFTSSIEIWTLQKNFFSKLAAKGTKASIEYWTGICLKLEGREGKIIGMHYEDSTGENFIDFTDSICIMSLGALENARQTLILKSGWSDSFPLAENRLDFATHHFIKVQGLIVKDLNKLFRFIPIARDFRARIRIRIQSRERNSLNGIFFMAPEIASFDNRADAIYSLRKNFASGTRYFLNKIWKLRGRFLQQIMDYMQRRSLKLSLWIQLEQNRSKNSFAVLTEDSQQSKFPILKVVCEMSMSERQLVISSAKECLQILDELGIKCEIENIDLLRKPEELVPSVMNPHTHFTCTTPMSDDAKTGETDKYGLSHTYQNLWYAGSSVFASASHANPTYSAILFAIRTGNQIVSKYNLAGE